MDSDDERRSDAEAQLNHRVKLKGEDLSAADNIRLLHELEVHQVELEAQNEELRSARAELDVVAARFTDLYDFAPVGYVTLDLQGRVTRVNFSAARLLGADRAKHTRNRMTQYIVLHDRAAFQSLLNQLEVSDDSQSCEVSLTVSCDSRRVSINAICAPDGRELYLALTDLTVREQALKALADSEKRLGSLVEHAPVCIQEIDLDGRLLTMNPAGLKMMEVPDEGAIRGLPYLAFVSKEDTPRVEKLFVQALQSRGSEFEFTSETGRRYSSSFVPIADSNGRVQRLMALSQDITARKKAEAEKGKLQEQLLQAQKMKAVGTLAGGIAHDFNNILMGLLGGLSLLEVEPSELAPYNDPAERQSDIQDMKGLVERGAQLTSQLLGFARLGKYDVKPLDLGHIVAQTSAMFGSTRRDIMVHLEVEPALSPVLMDHSQMEQMLLNLFINASQAMEGGGQLRVRLEEVLLGPKDMEAHEATPGQFVKIVVTDTGTGMDAATQARIFEPFFTTKEPGKGTGLGLASVYGILKGYNGFIEVESELGKGTTFTLLLARIGRAGCLGEGSGSDGPARQRDHPGRGRRGDGLERVRPHARKAGIRGVVRRRRQGGGRASTATWSEDLARHSRPDHARDERCRDLPGPAGCPAGRQGVAGERLQQRWASAGAARRGVQRLHAEALRRKHALSEGERVLLRLTSRASLAFESLEASHQRFFDHRQLRQHVPCVPERNR